MTLLPLRFAVRYLFARKSFNVINRISAIGIAGIAIGTAALVIIMSVFNGFNRIVSDSLSDSTPDLLIRPAAGKVFVPDSSVFSRIAEADDIVRLSSVLEDQAFVSYEGRQSLCRVKGVDRSWDDESPLRPYLISGEWRLRRGEMPCAVAGATLARSLGLNPRFVTPLEIYYPSRKESIQIANPAASLRSVKMRTSGTFSINAELDSKLLVVPIESMRTLLEYPVELSSVEIWTAPGKAGTQRERLQELLGPGFQVLDRYGQNASVLRMMKAEKLAIYLILVFVVVIVAFNIYSALKMLVIEKQADVGTLRAMGAGEGMLRSIFVLEGWLCSLIGMAAGLVVGICFTLAQARWGIVPMPGNYIVPYYPVELRLTDILAAGVTVSLVGFVIACLAIDRK